MSDSARELFTLFALFGVIVPSVFFAVGALRRVRQVFHPFGRANQVMRRWFTFSMSFAVLMVLSFFVTFQGWILVPRDDYSEERAFVFMIGFVSMMEMLGFLFFAWDLWWRGSHVLGRPWWLTLLMRILDSLRGKDARA